MPARVQYLQLHRILDASDALNYPVVGVTEIRDSKKYWQKMATKFSRTVTPLLRIQDCTYKFKLEITDKNVDPHLGHMFKAVMADCEVRFRSLMPKNERYKGITCIDLYGKQYAAD